MNALAYESIVCPNPDGTSDLEIYHKEGGHYLTLKRTKHQTFCSHYMATTHRDDMEAEVFMTAYLADQQCEKM